MGLMTGMAISAGIGAASAAVAANQAKQQAKGAMGQQQRQYDEDKAFREAQFADEKNRRDKAEAPLWNELNQSPNVAFGKYKGNIDQNFDNANRAVTEQVAQGKMAGSGLDDALHQGDELERAKALSSAWRQGIADKQQLAGFLAGRTNTLAAGGMVDQGVQNRANFWGDRANQWNAAAQQGWGAAAQGLGNLYSIGKGAGWWGGTAAPARVPWPAVGGSGASTSNGASATSGADPAFTNNWGGVSTGYTPWK